MKSRVYVSPLKNLPQIIDMERMFCINKKRQFTFRQQREEGESTEGRVGKGRQGKRSAKKTVEERIDDRREGDESRR